MAHKSIKENSKGLTETEVAIRGPVWLCVCCVLCIYVMVVLLGDLVRILTVGVGVYLVLSPVPGTLFLLLGYLIQPCYEGIYLVFL